MSFFVRHFYNTLTAMRYFFAAGDIKKKT